MDGSGVTGCGGDAIRWDIMRRPEAQRVSLWLGIAAGNAIEDPVRYLGVALRLTRVAPVRCRGRTGN